MKAKKSLDLKTTYGFARAKKALGQNFLKSEIALRKIAEAGEIKKGDVILEIGPGRGALTEKLLEILSDLSEGSPRSGRSGFVIAVEKDRELFESLKIKFEKEIKSNTLILICGDILKFDIDKTIKDATLRTAHNFNYKIIANIPYNITGSILKKFLTAENQPALMALMVQREVAKRIIARDGKESLLSISVKAYGEPKMIMKVEARYFSPSPKVDSAIISIKNISRKIFRENGVDEEIFWKIVKAGFAHKRKKLSSNLKTLQKKGSLASVYLASLGDKRAENLTLADWITLAKQTQVNLYTQLL